MQRVSPYSWMTQFNKRLLNVNMRGGKEKGRRKGAPRALRECQAKRREVAQVMKIVPAVSVFSTCNTQHTMQLRYNS